MAKGIYKSRRRQLLNSIKTARRCKLGGIARRFQVELAELRLCVAS